MEEGEKDRSIGEMGKETIVNEMVMSLQRQKDFVVPNTVPRSPGIFDTFFSARSSASESPFRKLNLSPQQLSTFNVKNFHSWSLAF